jgi:manganese/iron transport system substrate-binding protein
MVLWSKGVAGRLAVRERWPWIAVAHWLIVMAFLAFGSAAARGADSPLIATEEATTNEKRRIVCSTTQVADFARQVVGDRWHVESILAAGQDPHGYEIKPTDAQTVRTSDLCIENGWHLEGGDWMGVLARGASRPLVTCVERVQPLLVQQNGAATAVPDPHAWFSPVNAAVYVRNIAAAVSAMDPEYKGIYESRTSLYLEQLRALDRWIRQEIHRIPPEQRILVTSHDAFNYFCQEYGFQASAPVGWSTSEVGAEVTPARRKKVVESIVKTGVPVIFVETSVNPELIREIAKEAGIRIGGTLYSDSMGPPGSLGETYLGMMRENVLTLVRAYKE